MHINTNRPRPWRRRPTLFAFVAAAVLAGSAVTIPAGPAEAAETTATTVTLVSETYDFVGNGAALFWRQGPDQVTVAGDVTEAVKVRAIATAAGQTDDFEFTFAGTPGNALTTGTYENAQLPNLREPGRAGVYIAGNGKSCSSGAGRFTVHEIAPDLSRLWINYEFGCGSGRPASFGEIRYNMPADSEVLVAPSLIEWPLKRFGEIGRRVPIRMVNTGSVPVLVGEFTKSGEARQAFSTPDSACGVIQPGATCVFDVGFTARSDAVYGATLTIADSTPRGSHSVNLRMAPATTGASPNYPANPSPSPTGSPATVVGVAPDSVINLQFTPDLSEPRLTWVNPQTLDYSHTVVRGAPGPTPPSDPTQGFSVYSGPVPEAVLPDTLQVGQTYSFAAFAVDAEGFAAIPDTETLNGTRVSLSAAPTRVTYGQNVVFRGQVQDSATGAALGGGEVDLLAVNRAGELLYAGYAYANDDGSFAITFAPAANLQYIAAYIGDSSHLGGSGGPVPISVAHSVYAQPVKKSGKLGTTFTVVAGVDPLSGGQPVVLEQRVKNKWKKVTTAKLGKNGIVKIMVTPKTKGTFTYRVVKAGDADNGAGSSKQFTLRTT